MKKFIIIALMLAALLSCDFEERLDDMEGRIAKLEELCSRMNEEISAIQEIITALQNKDYVTSVEPVMSEGKEIGYTITFSQSGSVTIYHGKDGHNPTVGAKADTDGIYYWTINGEWLLDVKGNKLPVTGKDGITPQLKIENGYWYVSYDNGANWIQLGRATGNDGKDGDSFFQNVTVTETEVIFTLADGTTFTLFRSRKVSISFDITDNEAVVFAGKSITIKYTLANATDSTVVTASSDGQYIVKVKKTDRSSGKFIVKCPDPYVDGFINVMVSDNGYSFVKVINFYENKIEFPSGLEYNMNADGGTVAIPVSFNFDYTVKVSQDAASWLSIPAQTKAPEMKQDTIKITVAENTGRTSRSGKVFIYANAFPDKPCQEIIIKQERYISPAEKDMVFKVRVNFLNNFTAYLPLCGEIDCTIEWGDGSVESYIETNPVYVNGSYEYVFINHKYDITEAASYEVRISGKVTELSSSHSIPSHSVQEVEQWGATGLISLADAFNGNTLLTKVAKPDSLSFKDVTSFDYAFYSCTSLTALPENLFSNCPNVTDFYETFDYCRSLTSIPENLFANCPNVTFFGRTFAYCYSLTTIPENLFDNNRKVKVFNGTFYGCTSLTGESPYTVIDGVKYHLYERENNPDHFVKPDGHECFYDCYSLSDFDQIPDYWKYY